MSSRTANSSSRPASSEDAILSAFFSRDESSCGKVTSLTFSFISFYSTTASGRAIDSRVRRSAATAYRHAIAPAPTIKTEPNR